MSNLIACSHPGKSGDIVYSIPSAKWLCDHFETKCHFYISEYYKWLQRMLNYQDHFVEECITPKTYNIDHHGWGAQPWDMQSHFRSVDYGGIYQFGFRNFPDRPLPEWYLHSVGFDGIHPTFVGTFKYPEIETLEEDYVCTAARCDPSFERSFLDFMDKCPILVVQIGMEGEAWDHPNSFNACGVDWLETLSWLSKAKGFYGRISSQAGLAHNFDMPKVFPWHEGWDMRHVVRTESSLYIQQDSVNGFVPGEIVLEFMGLR